MDGDRHALADALAAQLNGVRRVLRRRVRGRLDISDISDVPGRRPLTGSQVELLRLVESAPGIGVGAAAQALHLAGNSVSTLVNQLTEAGMLRREQDPADRRSARLLLTDAAADRLRSWRAARVALLADALDELAPEDRQTLAAAVPALARLTTVLTADSPAPSGAPAAPADAGPADGAVFAQGAGFAQGAAVFAQGAGAARDAVGGDEA